MNYPSLTPTVFSLSEYPRKEHGFPSRHFWHQYTWENDFVWEMRGGSEHLTRPPLMCKLLNLLDSCAVQAVAVVSQQAYTINIFIAGPRILCCVLSSSPFRDCPPVHAPPSLSWFVLQFIEPHARVHYPVRMRATGSSDWSCLFYMCI